MAKGADELNRALHSKEAEGLLKDKAALSALLRSPETAKLMQLLEQKSGGNLKSAAQAATKGDTSKIIELMNEVMAAQEGAKAVEDLKKKLPGQ